MVSEGRSQDRARKNSAEPKREPIQSTASKHNDASQERAITPQDRSTVKRPRTNYRTNLIEEGVEMLK